MSTWTKSVASLSLTFLGTGSGGGPTVTRACSAISLNFPDHHWHCAEGTKLQIVKTRPPRVHLAGIRKVFITHMHVDHCMGIVSLMRAARSLPARSGEVMSKRHEIRGITPLLEIFGPPGLRNFIRNNLLSTHTHLRGRYTVHELYSETPPNKKPSSKSLHTSEIFGRDIMCGSDNLWRNITHNEWFRVDAGPIEHRGFVFTEHGGKPDDPNKDHDGLRKVVVLGDTSDASQIREIAMDPSVLVHEATHAYIPFLSSKVSSTLSGTASNVAPSESGLDSARRFAINEGHSTPDMAGEFALSVRARRLYLTHMGSRYPNPGPDPSNFKDDSPYAHERKERYSQRLAVIKEIETQASEAWCSPHIEAVVARDLLVIPIEPVYLNEYPTPIRVRRRLSPEN